MLSLLPVKKLSRQMTWGGGGMGGGRGGGRAGGCMQEAGHMAGKGLADGLGWVGRCTTQAFMTSRGS